MADVAVVTGASRGMGLACARMLAPRCDHLVVADLVEPDPDAFGGAAAVDAVRCDVADAADVGALADRAADSGDVRWIVHAAGVSPTMGDARRMFTVDLQGSAHIVDAFGPVVAAGGAAVLFASMAARLVAGGSDAELDAILADPLSAGAADRFVGAAGVRDDPSMAYSWAKQGVVRLAARSAADWGGRGARINTVSPGSINTPMGRQEFAQQPMMAVLLEQTPLGRLGEDADVVAAVEFLLSDAAGYVTGTDLLVDGGVVAALLG